MIEFLQYEKSYGNRLIVKADMKLDENFYWLKGGNGSGKSTLLKSVAALIPHKGSIIVNGLSVKQNRVAYRASISYAEAEPLYPDFLTGNDMLRFYVDVRRADDTQVNDIVESLGISTYLHSKIGTYSSGMLKKLSLALAFIGKPSLIMLDEPYITIDTAGQQQLNDIIIKRCGEGATILLTSHQHLQFEGQLKPKLLEIHQAELVKRDI